MKKTVEKEIYKINRWVKKETNEDVDILDFLFDAEENYELMTMEKKQLVII